MLLRHPSHAPTFDTGLQWAQANPAQSTVGASPEDAVWAFGPGALDFARVSLVSLYQMAGRSFMAEFSAELPIEAPRRPLPPTPPIPQTYRKDLPLILYGDPVYMPPK